MKHQTISFIKSGFRLAACVPLITFHHFTDPLVALAITGWFFFVAEIIGIIEEIGHE